MDGSLDQLMRLLSNRGLEWLRQRIMALPDPCPPDHPDLDALAMVGLAAPVLSGLRGRISPIEVIVLRRLTPALVQSAVRRVLQGARDPDQVRLVLTGGLVAPDDPLWQLACEALADDPALPLPQRLALSGDPTLIAQAEAVLTHIPQHITTQHVTHVAQILGQLYHYGARRPRLSHPRVFTLIFDHLRALADWAQAARCTTSVAQLAFCLRLLDSDYPVADMISDLIGVQRPDGSFPARMGYGSADQGFAQAVQPTLVVAMALHMAAWRRWRGPAPVWLEPHPLRSAARHLAGRIACQTVPPAMALHVAASLTRATSENWFTRLSPPRLADPAMISRLAQVCFRDPVAARDLRAWLALDRPRNRPPGLAGVEAAWLRGCPIAIARPAPPALLALWDRAAQRGDHETYLGCARLTLHHTDAPSTPAIRAMGRRMALEAMTSDGTLPQMLAHLDRLALLAQLFEPPVQAAAAA